MSKKTVLVGQEEKVRLERAGGKLNESEFQLGEVSQGLKAALLDKFFGGREALSLIHI